MADSAQSAQMEQMWELQTQTTGLRRHVVQLSSQLSSGQKERDVLAVTVAELDKLPPTTRTFRAVGKMFALAGREALRNDLEEGVAQSKKRDEGRAALRDQFMGKLKDAEAQAEQLAAAMEANPAFRKPLGDAK
jgi:chaperonin cofactor prefoldin